MLLKMFSRLFIANITTKRFMQQKPFRITPSEVLWNHIEGNKINSLEDWRNVRAEVLSKNRSITLSNIDAMTVGVCTSKKQYNLALSYLNFLKEEGIQPNLATIGKHFKLLYTRGAEGLKDESQILSLYESVRKTYPVLDAITLDNIILALSLTKQWKSCIDLLDEIRIASIPSSTAFSCVIAAAFLNGEEELAWKLLSEAFVLDKSIRHTVYESYFKKAKNSKNQLGEVEKLFEAMQKYDLKLDSTSEASFVDFCKSTKRPISSSTIHGRGVCKACNQRLAKFDLTQSDFNELKENFIDKVIIGRDIFNKSNPKELNRFQDFIANMQKFDVIIDGLNVAYSAGSKHSPLVLSAMLSSVVSHFAQSGKKVLVLGRNHMSTWPKQKWNLITQQATVFLTENLSHDDPYLLYCALNSGKDTIIVTRDLMRSHKFLLKEPRLKMLFDRWLTQMQYMVLRVPQRGEPVFKMPLPFSYTAQKIGTCWHIPCVPVKDSSATRWLCIQV